MLEDEYVAFCLDQAVRVFGQTLSARLDSVDEKTVEKSKRERQRILDQVLTPGVTPKNRYVDPATKFA
jgi:hypothetical protein